MLHAEVEERHSICYVIDMSQSLVYGHCIVDISISYTVDPPGGVGFPSRSIQ